MYSFRNDYSEGAHSKVLQALMETNLEQTVGYGLDPRCEAARETIRRLCNAPDAAVHFLVGGTQTNMLVIESLLQPYEAVISAHTGHVNVHETGAIEATGHKVCTAYAPDGKLTPELVESVVKGHSSEHMVLPRLVYISNTTEVGTIYRKAELEALRRCCDEHGLFLFLDGARLGSALTCPENDLTLADLAALTDAFYIGGTKMGALCGEAVVFTKNNVPKHFVNVIKKHGALMAKGRLVGVQFDALFTDGLYFEIGKHGIDMAMQLKEIFSRKGYRFFMDSPTNQQFVILPNEQIEMLKQKIAFSFWEEYDEHHTVVRFATGWSTTKEDLAYLESLV